jgi:hypothetical protein
MDFRIADTFVDSLARLTGDEQKAVKTTAFDLQMNPSNPGHSFHKLDKAKDNRFWSVHLNSDTAGASSKRKLERIPVTVMQRGVPEATIVFEV